MISYKAKIYFVNGSVPLEVECDFDGVDCGVLYFVATDKHVFHIPVGSIQYIEFDAQRYARMEQGCQEERDKAACTCNK